MTPPDETPHRRPRVAGERRMQRLRTGGREPRPPADAPPAALADGHGDTTAGSGALADGHGDTTNAAGATVAATGTADAETAGAETAAGETAAEVDGATPRRRRIRRPRLAPLRRLAPTGPGGWLVASLTVIVLALAASVGVYASRESYAQGVVDTRKQAVATAETVAESLFSVDYRHLDQWGAKAAPYLSPAFKKKDYQQTRTVVTTLAKDNKGVLKASVVAAAVRDATPDRASVLVFLDISSTIAKRPTPRIDRNRLQLSLVRENGHWYVDRAIAV